MSHAHTILAIDDDPDDLGILNDALCAFDPDCVVVTAQNGAHGLKVLEELKANNNLPCLIVLDINMPVMDGRQTFSALKHDEALRDIPIVIFSTSSNAMDKAFFAGKATEYMVKPVNYNDFLMAAQRFLQHCKT
jgi:CheY-like chemotaxis protein